MITLTPKEKAQELVDKFMTIDSDSEMFDGFKMKQFYAQRCALIAVRFAKGNPFAGGYNDYLDQVEQEINNL